MEKFILGKKIGMSQLFDEKGDLVPITIIEAGPCKVLQVKKKEKDGYPAFQLGFQELVARKVKKPMKGKEFRHIREFRPKDKIEEENKNLAACENLDSFGNKNLAACENLDSFGNKNLAAGENLDSRFARNKIEFKEGDLVKVSIFVPGEKVSVSGISKGKGFQGAVKRWKFHGKNATHGSRHDERTLGSVGTSFPQRVLKGRKMPGRMGRKRVTVNNLLVVRVEPEKNLLAVRGAIPGRNGVLIEVRGYVK